MQRRKRVKRKMATNPDMTFSYKKVEFLSRFLNEQGSIISREETNLLRKQQNQLAREVKRARHLALLPFTQTL